MQCVSMNTAGYSFHFFCNSNVKMWIGSVFVFSFDNRANGKCDKKLRSLKNPFRMNLLCDTYPEIIQRWL